MSKNNPFYITREDFVNTIKQFKQEHGIKLKQLFATDSRNKFYYQELLKQFFDNPTILEYLTRSAEQVEFLEYRPNLTSHPDEQDKFNSDYYELKIYQLLKTLIPYRDRATSDSFYKVGTDHKLTTTFVQLRSDALQQGILVDTVKDIYQIRTFITTILLRKYDQTAEPEHTARLDALPNLRFVITPNWKDGHATTIVHILDSQNNKALTSILINSRIDEGYVDFISGRFNFASNQIYYTAKFNIAAMIEDYFPSYDGITEEVIISADGTKSLIGNNDCFSNDPNNIIELSIQRNNTSSLQRFALLKKIPIIDASHNLQTTPDDENCVLYGINFIKALITMLGNGQIADKVYTLSHLVNQGDAQVKDELIKIFQEDLKSYLPMYYTAEKTIKSHEDIKKHHLKQRWNIGNETISKGITL
ncbi:hypothetical protein [Rickettsiales endosymbiont of Stachyamoeba lipophora]|uniref:hypothetical protein n=1 Tax=Rickettsiales endosymbiont of Stachyamoeba lipophora TaxID=2486578 RepID=UPI000F646BD6|nr:hypothetical protein [Rickettsiales endosymbiont of Stachyamoeba lipophora]AZL15921.1 hypothetical protein EF513_05120 [Rickettsiales endosymbiont of Stachyamoeba lipophora]